jgi:transcriptional regulator with PAS, ATPase and Fis domain
LSLNRLSQKWGQVHYIGSAVMRSAAERIATVASTDVPILILGETGTGKELFARLAHRLSERHRKDLVPVNCAAIPKELMESYLFGHVKGAYTGASSNRIGKFEQAHESTLFLDEIAELTPDAQAKLLRVLQDGNIEPLGSHQPRKLDVRIVSATNRNLQEDMQTGKFREDLYFRLRGVEVSLPPLRERREEISLLAVTLLDRINQRFHRQRSLTKNALARLVSYYWPGNVRELEAALRESVLFAERDELEAEDLKMSGDVTSSDYFNSFPEPEAGFDLRAFLAQARAHLIRRALSSCGGNQSQAARLLGITRQALNDFLSNPPANLA